jgi:hypothetical protein
MLLPFLCRDPESGESPAIQLAEEIEERLRRTASMTEIYRYTEEDVSLDLMRTIGQYNVIFMITHGSVGIDQWIFTGERVTAKNLWEWFTSVGGIGLGRIDGKSFLMISKWFIKGLQFNNSLVFMNACYSAKRNDLANAFLNTGAAVYLGWTGITYCQEDFFMGQVSKAIFDKLSEPNMTVSQAYNTPAVAVQGAYYSVNDLYPITLYRDDDGDKKGNIRYANGIYLTTPGEETERSFWYALDFVYKGNNNFVLSPAVYAESSNHLYAVEPSTYGRDVHIGAIKTAEGSSPQITDIAWDQTTKSLYALSFETLYQIDPETCRADPIGTRLGIDDVNALAFDTFGNLYSATVAGQLVMIDTSSGQASIVGSLGSDYEASGDLAFGPDGSLFGTVKAPGRTTNLLIRVNPSTGKATEIGDTAYRDVFGLFFVGNHLYGVTAENLLISLDTKTGSGTLVRQLSFSAWGAQNADN